MMTERLTMDMVEALELMIFNGGYISNDMVKSKELPTHELIQLDCVQLRLSGAYHITDTGRKALATYKAQHDLVLFIAEFEEQLEAEVASAYKVRLMYEHPVYEQHDILEGVLEMWRQCKKRIEQPSDE